MRLSFAVSVALVALAGCKPAEVSLCTDFCNELVGHCGYAAFPTLESCQQGCEYDASQGADVEAQYDCVVAAGCDTFQIIECQHEYGLTTEEGTTATGT